MQVISSHFRDVKLLRPARHVDNRGFFSEAYSKRAYAANGIRNEFVQDNHSLSRKKGVVRGLHFQRPPAAQAKLLRVLRAEDWNQIFIPAGFAHGFCTLQDETEILYKVDNYYSPEHDAGIRWNDPALGIAWPVTAAEAELSEKDRALPLMAELAADFHYETPAAAAPEGTGRARGTVPGDLLRTPRID